MLELLICLSKYEYALAKALSERPQRWRREAQTGLRKVAAGKRRLSKSMLFAASQIRKGARRTPSIPGFGHLREDVCDSLSFLVEAMGAGASGSELAEALAHHEYLKWNGLFLAVAGMVREGFPEGTPLLVRAQRHKKTVEAFLELEGSSHGLFRLRASEPAWRERFLLIGSVCQDVEQGLRREGIVERSVRGKDAIERLRERYYGAVIADEDLPDLAGVELCKKASRMFPGIEERFLFLYGGLEKKKRRLNGKMPRRLHKSAPRGVILEEVGLILDR